VVKFGSRYVTVCLKILWISAMAVGESEFTR
jgi:hypothetical protein